MLLFLRIKSC